MEQTAAGADYTVLIILAVAAMDLVMAIFFYLQAQPFVTSSAPATAKVVKAGKPVQGVQILTITYTDSMKQEHTVDLRHGAGSGDAKDGDTLEVVYLKNDPTKVKTPAGVKTAKMLPLILAGSAVMLVVLSVVMVVAGVFPAPF